jgi:hypothetical protein
MLETITCVLVRSSRRLHHTIQGQILKNNNFNHLNSFLKEATERDPAPTSFAYTFIVLIYMKYRHDCYTEIVKTRHLPRKE